MAFEAPALLWLPAGLEGDLQVEAGAQGYLVAVSEDFLTKTVAGSAEALHLRRTIDRLVLLTSGQVAEAFGAVTYCCDALVREIRVSGSWHDDDDVVACPAALSASVAFGHVR